MELASPLQQYAHVFAHCWISGDQNSFFIIRDRLWGHAHADNRKHPLPVHFSGEADEDSSGKKKNPVLGAKKTNLIKV